MIDLIIPTYKNKKGLIKTLESIDWSLSQISVYIVDDCSNLDYSDIIERFPKIKNWFFLEKNCGPGCARQYGIEHTLNPYIMFMDTGDFFINKEVQEKMINTIMENPRVKMFNWLFLEGDHYSKHTSNHLHSKVYSRNFLLFYEITFCAESSYANEDIGFNRACRMILEGRPHALLNINTVLTVWDIDDSSLTRGNPDYTYKTQNIALALNCIHSHQIAQKNKVSLDVRHQDLVDIMGSMYITFVYTAVKKPEFIQFAWDGAKLFYNELYKKENIKDEYIQMRWSQVVSRIYKHFKPPFTLNLRRFILELGKCENIPSNYLTFDRK